MTTVKPPARFGEVFLKGSRITKFEEKPQLNRNWINGGFFVFNYEIFKFIKEIQGDIVKGNDPLERRKKWENQISFGDGLKGWFKNTLTTPRFRKKTIKDIKGALNVWVFHNSHDPEVRKKLNVLEDLKHKKLSAITKKHIKNLH